MNPIWSHTPATKHVCPLWQWGDFVISDHGPNNGGFCVSLRPPGQHIPIGQFDSLAKARNAAESVDLLAMSYDGRKLVSL